MSAQVRGGRHRWPPSETTPRAGGQPPRATSPRLLAVMTSQLSCLQNSRLLSFSVPLLSRQVTSCFLLLSSGWPSSPSSSSSGGLGSCTNSQQPVCRLEVNQQFCSPPVPSREVIDRSWPSTICTPVILIVFWHPRRLPFCFSSFGELHHCHCDHHQHDKQVASLGWLVKWASWRLADTGQFVQKGRAINGAMGAGT